MQQHQRQQQQGHWNSPYRSRERIQEHQHPHQHQYQYQQQHPTRVMANSPMAFPPVGPLQAQYAPPQPAYYAAAGPPLMNPPPTPFDTAYGITLLPSHLLIGSPFVSSPDLFQSQQQSQQHHHNHHHQMGMVSSNASHQSINQRNRRPANQRNKGNSNATTTTTTATTNNNNNSTNVNSNGHSRLSQTSYPVPPLKNPPAVARNRHRRRAQNEQADKLFKEPFVVTYRMLPKGDDEYRTRSLLFENVNGSIDLYSFVSKYSKYGPVESIYMFKDRNDETKRSVLLSFLSRKICLDSYNSVLQRLAEFKTGLKSKSLTVSFVSLKYGKHVDQNEDDRNDSSSSTQMNDNGDSDSSKTPGPINNVQDDAYNVTVIASLQYDIINRGATRSVALELDGDHDKTRLLDQELDFLSPEKNQRYVLESIYLINAKESHKHFPKNYVILTFLNISMAVEVLDYVRNNEAARSKFPQCFFVSVSSCPQTSSDGSIITTSNSITPVASSGSAGIATNGNLGSYASKNASLSSLNSVGSYVSLDQEIDFLSSSLQGGHTITVAVNEYPKPFFAEFSDHLSNASVLEASALDTQFSSPHPQEVTVPSQDSPLVAGAPSMDTVHPGTASSLSSQVLPLQPPMAMGSGIYMEPFGRRNKNMVKPITQSLQKQFATSAEVANSMGGGIGNRTVYIGNIHPRSKPGDICNVVRGGILQNIRFLQEKHICFVTFIEASTAVQFYTNAFIDPIVLHGNMLKVGWGHHSGPLPKSISLAVTVGASRNVYVSLPDFAFKDKYINDPQYQRYSDKYKLPAEEQLRKDFSQYGDIEQINFLSDGHCCWVNFMNISSAIKLVEEVKYDDGEAFHKSFDNRYRGLIIGYGKDRCGNVNKNLIAGKNSRFYKKVKKPSYNIRLSRMEEERKKHEETLRLQNQNNGEKLLQFDSLGIHLEGNEGSKSSKETSLNGQEGEEKEEEENQEEGEKLEGTERTNIGSGREEEENKDQKPLEAMSNGGHNQNHGGAEKYHEEEKELLKLSNKSQIMDGLGIAAVAAGDNKDMGVNQHQDILDRARESGDEESVDSGISFNVELILHSPLEGDSNYQKKFNENNKVSKSKKLEGVNAIGTGGVSRYNSSLGESASAVSNPSINVNPPMAPSTISRNYSLMMRKQNGCPHAGRDSSDRQNSQQHHHQQQQQQQQQQRRTSSSSYNNGDHMPSQGGNPRSQQGRRRNKRRNAKAIPGSDVMAQYLAQLQHSTFMYAANILGATAEGDVDYYDDNTEH
ncbi:hypothetical protein ZYGR_0AZ01380 [Zygosaccharomyces rouxii]|uniref:RRM domain-containing protein n=1 Tax=Zygosaccharomyces rouxii TaxID=4956 RepID=A0A1Q3AJQ2_ZYGRO|nr:hypothetical protein ZYGR_0AZ01380 [Zygosaccharomyces rouxii]